MIRKILYICKKIFSSFNNHLTLVDKRLQDIRSKGMGSKS